MGLLDDPNTMAQLQLGAGLLGGGSFGQALNRGLLGYQGTLDGASDRKAKQAYLQSQIEENATQNAIRKSTLARQAKQDAYFFGEGLGGASSAGQMPGQGVTGSGGTAPMPGQGVTSAGGTAPMPGGAPAGAPGMGKFDEWSRQFGIPKDALVTDYLNNGGKGIAEMLAKRGTPDMQVSNGYAYDKNRLGAGYLPSLSTSQDGKTSMVQIGADGLPVVSAPRGALDTFNGYQGAQASFKPIKVFNPETQREEFTSEAAAVGRAPGPMAGPRGNVQSSAYSGGDRNAANVETIRMIQAEAQKPGVTEQDKAAFGREIQRLQMQSGITNAQLPQAGGVAAGPSAAEAAANKAAEVRAVDTAKADVARDTVARAKVKNANETVSSVDRAIDLLGQNPTGSGVGQLRDNVNAYFGKSTPAADVAAQLDVVSADIVKNVPRFEGPQSDKDVDQYKSAAGRVADRGLPVDQRISAAQEVKRLQAKAAGGDGASKPAGNLLQSLPPANNDNKGKRIRDTTTGKILVSNGMQWKEE
jgi:hypothetical protein